MEMNSSGAPLCSKTIFLDSNYLIFLSLFVKLCVTIGDEPTNLSILNSETLAKHGVDRGKLQMDRLKDGKEVFNYLMQEAQRGSEIITSRFCELEFLHLLLERHADKNLLNAGVPFRLRSKKHGLLYLNSLERTDYAEVAHEYEQYREKLDEHGIEVKILEESGDYQHQIVETAKIVMGNIMIDVPDAIVYATAVTAEADEILSTDEVLRTIANHLRNPGTEPWISIASSLIQKLKEENVSLKEATTLLPFRLPEAKKLPHSGPL